MKTKSHIIYKDSNKKAVPGVTTVGNQLDKPPLLPAAVKLERMGIDYKKHWDNLASIGTLGHAFSTDYLTGQVTDTSDYDPQQISKAENAFLSFLEWNKRNQIKVEFVEKPLVHEILRYGGTLDIYTKDRVLCDLKTGSGIYDEAVYQMAALRELLRFHGYAVDKCIILNIPRTEDESFMEKICSEKELEDGWQIFQCLLKIYYLRKGNK